MVLTTQIKVFKNGMDSQNQGNLKKPLTNLFHFFNVFSNKSSQQEVYYIVEIRRK